MPLKFKAMLLATYTLSLIAGTIYTHNKFIVAKEVAALKAQIKKSNKGQAEIIDFNQELRKTNAHKDPCFNTNLPADVKRLLK